MNDRDLDKMQERQNERLDAKPTLQLRASPRFDNNDDFVKNLMNFSPYGAICQAFILEAIRHYSKVVSASDPGPHDADVDGVVSKHLWCSIAKDVSKRTEDYLANIGKD